MPEEDAMTTFHVDSEVGVLRRVLLHRPGLELRRGRCGPRCMNCPLVRDAT